MSQARILIVGNGGREHALTWALSQSPQVGEIVIASGNAGTSQLGKNIAISPEDIPALVAFAQENPFDLVVVGPEVPLALGLTDELQKIGLRVFGPMRASAQIESSKAFAKQLMIEKNIPTAQYAEFTDEASARGYLQTCQHPVVIKADGLAAGKGVVVCDNEEQAQDALNFIIHTGGFGDASSKIIIEERLYGVEASLLAFCDGKTLSLMPPARDHKRALDGDNGANTGGMGAFAPIADLSADDLAYIQKTIMQPMVDALAERGTPFVGILYAGLMLTKDGAKVLEYNARFGDPETQVILPLLDTDLYEILTACVDGRLSELTIHWKNASCATVVLASGGYPASYPKGLPITGLEAVSGDVMVFHAGTSHSQEAVVVTSGGRVLAVSAIGDTLKSALDTAYDNITKIHFDGMHYRKDIGRTAGGLP
ncbi:MAG: phosphoribosylamine--glycine ligase [bacterium]|nr:phosphoribosylamine--glycine ligase [bacterium]